MYHEKALEEVPREEVFRLDAVDQRPKRLQERAAVTIQGLGNNYFTEMCSGSEAGSYLRLIDFVYHSTLGLRVIKKKNLSST